MEYGKKTVFVTGVSKASKDDPITNLYQIFFLSIIVERDTDIIVDTTCSAVSQMTVDFVKSLLVGYNIKTEIDQILEEIKKRFYGMAQRALLVACKDAQNKYLMIR